MAFGGCGVEGLQMGLKGQVQGPTVSAPPASSRRERDCLSGFWWGHDNKRLCTSTTFTSQRKTSGI